MNVFQTCGFGGLSTVHHVHGASCEGRDDNVISRSQHMLAWCHTSCDARDHMVHAFPPFHSLDLLSLACSFRWPYDTKGIVKHGTLMYIMNTLQLEWSSRSFSPFFCMCRRLRTLFSLSLLSLFSYRRNLGRDKPSRGRTSPLLFRR